MKRLLVVLVAVGAAIVGWSVAGGVVRSLRKSDADPKAVANLLRIASDLNQYTPMMVDSETEWINTGAEQGVIIYNYRLVHLDQSQVSGADLEATLSPGVVNAACTNPKTRERFLDRGVAMRYSYYDQTRHLMTSFDVTRSKCDR